MKSLFLIFLQAVSIGIIFISRGSASYRNEGTKRLIQTSEMEPPTWMTESEIFRLIEEKKGFMDVTDFNYAKARASKANVDAIPTALKFNDTVQNLITTLDSTERIEQFIRHFSSYHNRYYTSETGVEAQKWLFSKVQDALKDYVGNSLAVEFVHGDYPQNSVIARLEGVGTNKSSEVIIIGAHLDSIGNTRRHIAQYAKAPGADDNASGSAIVLETLRTIVNQGIILNRTVEFHWYAAEEVGHRGSQEIADAYVKQDVNVVGMLNLECAGYNVEGADQIAVYTDYASSDLVKFVKILADGYLEFGRRDKTCGYACSDHVSWYRNDYPAIVIAEAEDTPHIHRETDTISTIDFKQVNEFVKLVIGFVIEMGEPES